MQFLLQRGIDDVAFAEFKALASEGRRGYEHAMRLIHGICKRESGWYPVRNISAFLVTGCKDAWHTLEQG